jgi:hypothetical protein
MELVQCQIETYTFEERDMDLVRTVFPVEPCKKNKTDDKKYKWFGIRAEILKELFTALQDQGDIMTASKFAPLIKECAKRGRDLGKTQTPFTSLKPWPLTPGSRSQVYPTKSTSMIPGKVQWGVPMPLNFFTADVFHAVHVLGIQPTVTGTHQHIGPGWTILFHTPVAQHAYDKFHPAQRTQPLKKRKEGQNPVARPRRKKARVEPDVPIAPVDFVDGAEVPPASPSPYEPETPGLPDACF